MNQSKSIDLIKLFWIVVVLVVLIASI